MPKEGKKEGKKNGKKIGVVIVILFMLIYIPSMIHWISGKQITTDIIRNGYIESLYNLEGCLIRDEKIIKSPFAGNYIPDVVEGERVAVNSHIATVLGNASIEALEKRKKLDIRILEAKKKKNENLGLFSQDIIKLDDEITERVKLLASSSDARDMDKFEEIKSQIDNVIRKKAEILGGLGKTDAYFNSMNLEREALDQQVKASTKQIVSDTAGIISFNIDGLEGKFSTDSISNVTLNDLEDYGKIESIQNTNARSVEVNMPFAKIINGIDYYIASVVDKNLADSLKIEKNITIRINDVGRNIRAQIFSKSNPSNGKCVVVFKTDEALSDTTLLRRINIDLIKDSYEGLKVSFKSLVDVSKDEKKAKIVLVKANYASIREVEIIGRNGEFAIIKGVEKDFDKCVGLYDTYVINARNIVEGQMIGK